MDQQTTTIPQYNNVPQFSTPHSGGSGRIKTTIIGLIILLLFAFNIYYYFFRLSVVNETPVVLAPPTDEEKITLANDLSDRRPDISNDDKEAMMQSLGTNSGNSVIFEDRETSIPSLNN